MDMDLEDLARRVTQHQIGFVKIYPDGWSEPDVYHLGVDDISDQGHYTYGFRSREERDAVAAQAAAASGAALWDDDDIQRNPKVANYNKSFEDVVRATEEPSRKRWWRRG